jgi:hypothetical protein
VRFLPGARRAQGHPLDWKNLSESVLIQPREEWLSMHQVLGLPQGMAISYHRRLQALVEGTQETEYHLL